MVSLGDSVSAPNKIAQLEQKKEPWSVGLHSSNKRNSVLQSNYIKEKSVHAVQIPARNAGKVWREQQQWGLEDEKIAGVHWSYEETKTFLDILQETRFYEALQACHRKSKLYGVVAEQLRECGFLRTPEQCRTKFKSLQKSYRKVKNGHVLESCAFYKEMDALVNCRPSSLSTNTSEEVPSLSRQERGHIEVEPREPTTWEPVETPQEAVLEDSGSERLSEEEMIEEPELEGPSGLLQSPAGFEIGTIIKEDPTQVMFKDTEPHRVLMEKPKRLVSQNTNPSKYCKREYFSGRHCENLQGVRQGKLMSQPRDTGKAVVHQRPCVGRRPYRLLKYGENFGRSARLVCRMTHQKENPFKCGVCGKCFGRSRSLIRHQRIHTGEKPFKCPDCGKSFSKTSQLKAHSRIHTGERPYVCSVCGKAFKQLSTLSRHEKIHMVEKPYKCSFCGKSFCSPSELKVHLLIHTGERPYKCSSCWKAFCTKVQLQEHERIHTGERPYVCTHCGKAFRSRSVFSKHKLIHRKETPFICERCGKVFLQKSELTSHLQTHIEDKP